VEGCWWWFSTPACYARTRALPGIDVASRVAAQWRWIVFPEGFRSQRILELTLLQLWTLKPAAPRA